MNFSVEKISEEVVKHLSPFLRGRERPERPEQRERERNDFQELVWSYGKKCAAHYITYVAISQ